ncbi:MAG: hypothetical protein KBT11_06295 [Treponema sp.]|nr:hypothetical protein [Candidatus Treponema equifaecale]
MKKVVKIIAMAAMASFLSIGAMSCADSVTDDKPEASISTQTGANKAEDVEDETTNDDTTNQDPADKTPENTDKTPENTTPAAKINVTQDITKLDFTATTKGLKDTAAADKNGTYMIPTSVKILDVLTPSADDKAFWYSDKARSKISALQLNADSELSFKVSGAATVKVTFLSTDTANTSKITVNEDEKSVTGKTAKEFTWELSKAGDYSIKSSGTSNARITALSIVEK